MRIRFQADADLDARIVRGLKRAIPEIDFRDAADARLAQRTDPDVLRISAADGRVLVSRDRRTMPRHFRELITVATSPGVILVRRKVSIATAIDELALIWGASESEEWTNRLTRIPL